MYNIYFDSGTSNSRAYLLKDDNIIDKGKREIGSKDVSVAGSNSILLEGLKLLFDQMLERNNLSDKVIKNIYASGMVTSPFGIKKVPHLSTPLSREKLRNNVYNYFESEFFNREIKLIRGVKTVPEDFNVNRENFTSVNNMRGEEIEIFGMLAEVDSYISKDCCIFLPGSHTHIAKIKNSIMEDIISTFSGELFNAIKKETILSDSIDLSLMDYDKEMILKGAEIVDECGLNRALYLVNTMQIFTDMTRKEKTSFLEGVLTGQIIKIFKKKWSAANNIIITADKRMLQVYQVLLENECRSKNIISLVRGEGTSFAVRGFINLLKTENI